MIIVSYLLVAVNGVYCHAKSCKLFEQIRQEMEREHVGSVAFCNFGTLMCLYEDSIGADGYAGTCHGGDEVGRPPVTPALWFGCWSECVTSRITGHPFFFISGMPR